MRNRMQHETELKPSFKSKQRACGAPDGCARFLLAASHNRSIADCDIVSAIKRASAAMPRVCRGRERPRRVRIGSQANFLQYRAEHRVAHTVLEHRMDRLAVNVC